MTPANPKGPTENARPCEEGHRESNGVGRGVGDDKQLDQSTWFGATSGERAGIPMGFRVDVRHGFRPA